MGAVGTDQQFASQTPLFTFLSDKKLNPCLIGGCTDGYTVKPKGCSGLHTLLNHELVKPLSANDIGSQFTISAHGNQCAARAVNQSTVHFLEYGLVSTNGVHGRRRDQSRTLKRPADFFVFFQHQDSQAFLCEEGSSTPTDRTSANDDNIVVVLVHAFPCGRYCFNLPLENGQRSTFCKFIPYGLVLFQIECRRERVVGFL